MPKDLNSDCTVNKDDKPVEPTISCELHDPTGADSAKSEGILLKLLQIIKNDKSCIVDNREIFTQILAAVDQETVS